jgi:hypothetical protein
MTTSITIPEFNWTSFYYPQILEALIQYKRTNVPELTDESEFEPFMQLLRAFACVGHLNSVDTDIIANESTLPTANLVETVRNMLRLIDYDMSPATPAQVELLYELSKTFTSSIEVVSLNAKAATQRSGDDPIKTYEASEALTITRTDQIGFCFSVEDGTYTDRTTKIISTAGADDISPWSTAAVGDSLLFGHSNVMWDKLTLDITTGGSGFTGVWEFYDGDWTKTTPDSVTQAGSQLVLVINNLLGTTAVPNTTIRVTLNETGVYEEVTSEWYSPYNRVYVGFLGQTVPSTDPDDYSIGSDWTIMDVITDGTSNLQQSGDVEYDIPQSITQNWITTTLNGSTAYWLRYRIATITGPVSPIIRNALIDEGKLYVIRSATQGITVVEDPLGSSDGTADQRFDTSRENFISDSQTVTVDSVEWAETDDFVNSLSTDKHYTVELGEDDVATIVFGSGDAGKIPALGSDNIAITYRYGAQYDGNVGPDTITVDKQGLTAVASITNPRQASGWREADGSSTASLERVKKAGPASLRTKTVAISKDDVITLTLAYVDSNGSRLFSRAIAIEEGLGPKTIELVVVSQGGALATTEQLDDLAEYFNGNESADTPITSKIVANQRVTAYNYTPRTINITANVTTTATSTAAITDNLNQVFTPEALKSDGITYEWSFGGEVTTSRIIHEIFNADTAATKVVLVSPTSDIAFGARELPIIGTVAITIIEP